MAQSSARDQCPHPTRGTIRTRSRSRRSVASSLLLASLASLAVGPAVADPAAEPDPEVRRLEEKLDAALSAVESLRLELDALKARRAGPSATRGRAQASQGGGPARTSQGGLAPVAAPGPALPRLDARPAIYRPDQGPTVLLAQGSSDALLEKEKVSLDQRDPVLQPGALRQARAVLIGPGRLEIEPSLSFRHRNRNLLALRGLDLIENIFVGNVEVQRIRRSSLSSTISTRYGLSDRLQFNLGIPFTYIFDQTVLLPEVQRELGDSVEETGESGDIGDLEFGLSYHVLQEGERFEWLPIDLIASISVKTDTGQSPFEAGPDEFSTGSGFWGVRGGLTMLKVLDPAALFATVSYFYHIPSSRNTGGFDRVDPPDDVSWSAGMSWSMNPSLSLFTRVENRFVDKTEIDGASIDGSDLITASLVTGVTVRTSRRTSLDLSASVGLTDDTEDFEFRVSMPISFDTPFDLGRLFRGLSKGDWKW